MTLEQLRIFVAVAEREHVTGAAKALNLTQAAVSATIVTLEQRHDVRLFDRIGRGIKLTQIGRSFLEEARAVVARANEARRMLDDLGGLKRGRLPLVASQTIAGYWLPPFLARFQRRFPGITVDLTIGNSEQAAARVHDGAAELGFIEGPVNNAALARWQVGADQLVLIGVDPPDDPDAETLRTLPWLLREEGSGTRTALAQALQERGLAIEELEVRLTLPSNEALLTAVASGAGVTILSALVAGPLIAAGKVRAASFGLEARPFYALRHKDRYRAKTAEALLEIMK